MAFLNYARQAHSLSNLRYFSLNLFFNEALPFLPQTKNSVNNLNSTAKAKEEKGILFNQSRCVVIRGLTCIFEVRYKFHPRQRNCFRATCISGEASWSVFSKYKNKSIRINFIPRERKTVKLWQSNCVKICTSAMKMIHFTALCLPKPDFSFTSPTRKSDL